MTLRSSRFRRDGIVPTLSPAADRRRAAGVELFWGRMSGQAPPVRERDAVRREELLAGLQACGVRGRPELNTLYTGTLAPGCRICLSGRSTCLQVTNLCTRNCFFCPNERPRADAMTIGGLRIGSAEEAAVYLRRLKLEGAGLSGGDPLRVFPRTLALVRALKSALGRRFHLHLYTNGDGLTAKRLAALKEAGLDEIRFDLLANQHDLKPVRLALTRFAHVAVEIPVIPGSGNDLRPLMSELDAAGVPNLILHELFFNAANRAELTARGHAYKSGELPRFHMQRPAAGSEEEALALLLFAARRMRRLSVYYCSWTTQERLIEPRGWEHRRRALGRKKA